VEILLWVSKVHDKEGKKEIHRPNEEDVTVDAVKSKDLTRGNF